MDEEKKKKIITSLIDFVMDLPVGADALEGYWTDDNEECWNDLTELRDEVS